MFDVADIPFWEIVIRLTVAAVLGGLVGIDREVRNKPVGIRTYALVSLGSAAFTVIAIFIAINWATREGIQIDMMRAVSGIVGGIGFLGAGAIIQSRGSVKGITTAASIWLIASVGVACGIGAYVIAAVTVVLAYIILVVLLIVEIRLDVKSDHDECKAEDE